MPKNGMTPADLYEQVTAQIITAIEEGADPNNWHAPWHNTGATPTMTPSNALTGKHYKGSNIINFWLTANARTYPSGLWATYKQWTALDAQVRKGERATYGLKWVVKQGQGPVGSEGEQATRKVFPTCFAVFNVAQVDGWEPPEMTAGPDPIAHAEEFFAAIGARLTTGVNAAFYSPAGDSITAPALSQYDDPADYYSTLAHEHVHWTGHRSRLDRDLSGGFGSMNYAREELIAELGAAFVCARLGISNRPRADHAQYLASWLKVLRSDAKAITSAASKAQAAVDLLERLAGTAEEDDPTEATEDMGERVLVSV